MAKVVAITDTHNANLLDLKMDGQLLATGDSFDWVLNFQSIEYSEIYDILNASLRSDWQRIPLTLYSIEGNMRKFWSNLWNQDWSHLKIQQGTPNFAYLKYKHLKIKA